MSRTVAVVWHASFTVVAGVLYFFFTLPRWPELVGDTSPTLGTVLRIVTGALIGLAALPVVFTLLRTRRPEFSTPRLALALRIAAIALQVLAGVLIIGAALSEIWLDLDSAGPWLFGIYGAAAAITLLGAFCFYLAFVAELPPPPPKPVKPVRKARERDEQVEQKPDSAKDTDDSDTVEHSEDTEDTEDAENPEDTEAPDQDEPPATGLRNRRPAGKSGLGRRRRRTRGGVAVDD